MPVIAVVNRKGGSGKSTLATHLAAWYANQGLAVVLGDVDRQQSTQSWLRRRAAQKLESRGRIVGWNADPKAMVRPPSGFAHVILDTPGGLRGFELARVVMYADAVLMPVCNSAFDRESAADCAAELRQLPRVASGRCRIGAVGMRLDGGGRGAEQMQGWADGEQITLVGGLRYAFTYVKCIEQGLTLFDLPAGKVEPDRAQWQPILDWLGLLATDLRPPTVSQPLAAPAAVPARGSALPRSSAASRPAAPVAARPALARSPAPTPRVLRPREGAKPALPDMSMRLNRLIDALPIPRFLQRSP